LAKDLRDRFISVAPSPVESSSQVVPSPQRKDPDGRLRAQLQFIQNRKDPAHRSIPTTGQNSQIWYFPIQLKPVEEKEHEVNKRAHHWPSQRENMSKRGGGDVHWRKCIIMRIMMSSKLVTKLSQGDGPQQLDQRLAAKIIFKWLTLEWDFRMSQSFISHNPY